MCLAGRPCCHHGLIVRLLLPCLPCVMPDMGIGLFAHRGALWQLGTSSGKGHSGTLSTGYTAPCSVAPGPCGLEARSAHGPSFFALRPSQLALLCVDQCVSTLVSLLGRLAGSQCREIVPADTGDACEPANSCMLFACRLGGIFCPNSRTVLG